MQRTAEREGTKNHIPDNAHVKRINRTIKDATVKRFHYASITDLRRHVRDWLLTYNCAKQLKALWFKTLFEAIRQISKTKPYLFV